MGCSYDRFNAAFKKKEHTKLFAEIFNRELEEELYWGEDDFLTEESFSVNDFGDYMLWIDAEPLFCTMEAGNQLIDVIFAYLEAVPNSEFYAWYECTYNNCGAINYITYEYKNDVLTIVEKSSEDSYIDYCPECEWCAYEDEDFDEDALCTIDEWDENETYHCPKCGAVLEWDIFVDENSWKMIDGKLLPLNE